MNTPSKSRVTLRKIREALAAAGYDDAELVRGRGYYYFSGGLAAGMPESSVLGIRGLHAYTVEGWVDEFKRRLP